MGPGSIIGGPAVKKTDAKGTATNLLEIDYKRDTSRVSFRVNGRKFIGCRLI
jgi:hypothetical protein